MPYVALPEQWGEIARPGIIRVLSNCCEIHHLSLRHDINLPAAVNLNPALKCPDENSISERMLLRRHRVVSNLLPAVHHRVVSNHGFMRRSQLRDAITDA